MNSNMDLAAWMEGKQQEQGLNWLKENCWNLKKNCDSYLNFSEYTTYFRDTQGDWFRNSFFEGRPISLFTLPGPNAGLPQIRLLLLPFTDV